MDLEAELLAVVDALSGAGVDHAVCGGLAVAIHGFPRATQDIDLLVRREDVERAVTALRPLGYTLDAGSIPFRTGTPQESEARRLSRPAGSAILTLDLILVYPVFEDVWNDAEIVEWNERELTVVSAAGLARMKRISGRPKDLLDIEELGLDD